MIKISLDFEQPLSKEAMKSLRESSYYLDDSIVDVTISEGAICLTVASDHSIVEIRNKLETLIAQTKKNFKRVREQRLSFSQGEGNFCQDPLPILLDLNLVHRHAPGVFSYSGWLADLILGLDDYFQNFALEIGAKNELYPPTVLSQSLIAAGYIKSFPHHALFVTPAKRQSKHIEAVARNKCAEDLIDPLDLQSPEALLAPTICYRCFEAYKRSSFGDSEGMFTAIGHCSRNEGFIDDDMTRMQSFLMREIVFYGADNYVKKMRQKTIVHAQEFFIESGLTVQLCTASDPFFGVTSGDKAAYQSAAETKMEMRIHLPFQDRWISCMSFNNHESTLTEAFGITSKDQSRVYSGCTGYGYDRLVFGILSQYGTSLSRMPNAIRKLM